MQTETIGSCLLKLRKLNNELTKICNCLQRIQELEDEDGLRAYRNVTGVSTKGGGHSNQAERILIQKEAAGYDVDKLKEEADRLQVKMQDTLNDLRYKIRGKEWDLLSAVYVQQLSANKLEILHGRQWSKSLNNIFLQYGS